MMLHGVTKEASRNRSNTALSREYDRCSHATSSTHIFDSRYLEVLTKLSDHPVVFWTHFATWAEFDLGLVRERGPLGSRSLHDVPCTNYERKAENPITKVHQSEGS